MAVRTNHAKLVDSKGNPVPSISTILRKFQDPGGLLHWAWKVGKEGKTLDQARSDQTTAGHVSAARALASIGGETFLAGAYSRELVIATDRPFALFREWAGQHDVKIADVDKGMVADEDGYGGLVTTAVVDGKTIVLSLKAGKGVYTEDVLTVAAQAHLAKVERAVIIRFGKESGGFDEQRELGAENLLACWQVFFDLLRAFRGIKGVEQIALGGGA